ncbi:Lipoxygenase 2.1, chloroplastic [Dichanthelium oligosanthes]|uniref:Lipoxygenase 2.1, chloroplastic n=1 Tax=Dichanthelium oligosanthes TaxID=888268 RepID=A0A1E5W3J5_9POAL|nr:Lipoxygenase 2.1, chloroplastic [Dichanthelium oligosanthes]
MLTATQPLGATLSPSYGSSSFSSSTVSPAAGQQWAPRRGVSKVSCTCTSRFMYGQAIRTVDREETGLVPCCDEEGAELITLKATVKVQLKQEDSTNPEKVADMASRPWLLLEYFSSELDRGETGREKYTEQNEAKYSRTDRTISAQPSFIYEATLKVPYWFGAIGAVVVKNSYNSEVYISDIKVDVDDPYESSAVTFHCDSWVAFNPGHNERIFFPLKSYIPSQTPKGVEFLRRKELEAIRGDGHGERMGWERIYDYDVYNDLGDPDKDANAKRPVLGGRRRPYPRRCRTGRPRCKTDWRSETRANGGDIYVPRDEAFTERKAGAFNTKKVLSGLAAFTTKQKVPDDKKRSFPSLAAIDALYEDGYKNQPTEQEDNLKGYLQELLEEQVQLFLKGETEKVKEDLLKLLKYQTPEIHDRDSLITKELIEKEINGVMTAEEAVERKRLFMLDYHDMFLPYVHTVRELDDTTLYASRTLFFLTDLEEGRKLTEEAKGTLRPIAIELTRPKSPNLPQWRQVFTPGSSVTGSWLWQLAKTHVLAHDTGYHQLISHW